jgi:sterol desaturase/sphingolipid hydroxylase (fatty acid hydroxylase superfamily)
LPANAPVNQPHSTVAHVLQENWLVVFILALGLLEFSLGLYDEGWNRNEKALDIASLVFPKLILNPFYAWFSLKILPLVFPNQKNELAWVPFIWAFLIICVADDLTQYWYHRLHHEIPWLWRFHRTHHSAPYMGMAMANRQNAIYTLFFSQTHLTAILVYFGLGPAAVVVQIAKSLITTLAHSSLAWDRFLYKYRVLHSVTWVVERVISTPATHHAHHAATTVDGVGYYKGNFGNMFFLWDVIFGTGLISRQYPSTYGISHYRGDQWYAQLFWPVFKSNVPGSELAKDGPIVKVESEEEEPSALEPAQAC